MPSNLNANFTAVITPENGGYATDFLSLIDELRRGKYKIKYTWHVTAFMNNRIVNVDKLL